jgi:hypothetical protein
MYIHIFIIYASNIGTYRSLWNLWAKRLIPSYHIIYTLYYIVIIALGDLFCYAITFFSKQCMFASFRCDSLTRELVKIHCVMSKTQCDTYLYRLRALLLHYFDRVVVNNNNIKLKTLWWYSNKQFPTLNWTLLQVYCISHIDGNTNLSTMMKTKSDRYYA